MKQGSRCHTSSSPILLPCFIEFAKNPPFFHINRCAMTTNKSPPFCQVTVSLSCRQDSYGFTTSCAALAKSIAMSFRALFSSGQPSMLACRGGGSEGATVTLALDTSAATMSPRAWSVYDRFAPTASPIPHVAGSSRPFVWKTEVLPSAPGMKALCFTR